MQKDTYKTKTIISPSSFKSPTKLKKMSSWKSKIRDFDNQSPNNIKSMTDQFDQKSGQNNEDIEQKIINSDLNDTIKVINDSND